MYIPPHFAEMRPDALHRLIRAFPLGAIVIQGPDRLDADHLPFYLDPEQGPCGSLLAHVSRSNALWRQEQAETPVLVIFRGEQAYISPNWYPTKHDTHRQVPTWNYEVVHVHGTLTVHDDERFVRGMVGKLTRHHEATEPRPWKMSDSPREFIDGRLREIVGIKVKIDSIVGKSKLSQNREPQDRAGAAQELEARGQGALAGRMRERT